MRRQLHRRQPRRDGQRLHRRRSIGATARPPASPPSSSDRPGGFFNVSGSHTYAKPGVYTVTTNVFDDGGSTTTLIATFTITDLPVTGATKSFTAVEGQNTGMFVLATFEDPNTLATVADVHAELAVGGWGDGTPGAAGVGLVVQQIGVDPANGEPIFQVLGSHTYAEETPPGLPNTLSVIITTLGGATTTLTSPPGGGVTVLDAKLTGSAGNSITGIEGNDDRHRPARDLRRRQPGRRRRRLHHRHRHRAGRLG